METRHGRFKRLALKRTNDILNKIRILGNLSNKSSYSYNDDEIDKMFKAIDEQIKTTKTRFKLKKRKFKF